MRKKGCDLYAELLMPRLLLVRPLSIYFRSSVPRQGTLLHVSAILLVFLLARFRFVPLLLLRRPYGVSLSMSSSTNPHCSLRSLYIAIDALNVQLLTSPFVSFPAHHVLLCKPLARISTIYSYSSLLFQASPQSFGFARQIPISPSSLNV